MTADFGRADGTRNHEVPENPLEEAMKVLANDLASRGWDLPVGVYAIKGSPEDPTFALMAEEMGHPIMVLDGMYHTDKFLPEDAIGVVLTIEGYRVLSWDEISENNFALFMAALPSDMTDEDKVTLRDALTKDAWYAFIHSIDNLSTFAKSLRLEVRTVFTALKGNREVMTVEWVRGKDTPSFLPQEGILPEALRLFVNNEHPVPGVPDGPSPAEEMGLPFLNMGSIFEDLG